MMHSASAAIVGFLLTLAPHQDLTVPPVDGDPVVLAPLGSAELAEVPAADPIIAAPVAFAELSDDDVYARAMESLGEIDTLSARFTQSAPSGAISTGTVNLDRPGRLRFEYDAPSDQLIVATGGVVYVHDAALETTDSYPVGKTPLRFLLSKTIDPADAQLKEIYRTSEGVALMLTSTDEEISGELALVFTAPDMRLTEWVVLEPSGAATRVTLEDVSLGKRLPGRLFRVPDSGGAFLRDR